MGKTVVVGDMHLKQRWILPRVDAALERTGARRVVFTGDYCDDWGARDTFALGSLNEMRLWTAEKRAAGLRVDVLVGNHDLRYLMGEEGPGTQRGILWDVRRILEELGLAMAAAAGGFLITHAGVTAAWADVHFDPTMLEGGDGSAEKAACALNKMFADRAMWRMLDSCGSVRGGFGIPGPLWADLRELRADPLAGVSQIVGHTPVRWCAQVGEGIPGALNLWGCDTFSLTSMLAPIGDGGMLSVDDGGEVEVLDYAELGEGGWAHDVCAYIDAR